jgi:hypothetical protein
MPFTWFHAIAAANVERENDNQKCREKTDENSLNKIHHLFQPSDPCERNTNSNLLDDPWVSFLLLQKIADTFLMMIPVFLLLLQIVITFLMMIPVLLLLQFASVSQRK